MVAVVLGIILSIFTDIGFGNIMYISVAVTIIAYVIGDLLILASTNNTIATISDIGLAFVTIYLYNYLLGTYEISFWDSLIAAIIIGVGEWFFHKYFSENVLAKK